MQPSCQSDKNELIKELGQSKKTDDDRGVTAKNLSAFSSAEVQSILLASVWPGVNVVGLSENELTSVVERFSNSSKLIILLPLVE